MVWTLTQLGAGFRTIELRPVERQKVYLGRNSAEDDDDDVHVVCRSPHISRRHCLLQYRNGDWFACDLASMNGTFVNGTEIQPSDPRIDFYHWVQLSDGDIIGLEVAAVPPPEAFQDGQEQRDYFVFKFLKISY